MFYCKKVCGDDNFSIEEWNKASKMCDDTGITGMERDKILHPDLFPCTNQCFDCIATVGERQKRTADLIELSKTDKSTA
jgi:hypothetical protein